MKEKTTGHWNSPAWEIENSWPNIHEEIADQWCAAFCCTIVTYYCLSCLYSKLPHWDDRLTKEINL